MAKYINKSALVAEVVARYDECLKRAKIIDAEYWNGKADAYRDMLVVLGSPKIKEVDLELNSFDATVCKICNTYLKEMDKDAIVKALESYKDGDKVKVIIKAQKGE